VILEPSLFPRRRNGALILPLMVMARTLPAQISHMLLDLGVATFQRQITHEREFWIAYFHRAIASFSRQDILARLSILKDFYIHGRASLMKLEDWSGRALIVVAEADSLAPPRDCRDLLAHYAGAEVEVMSGSSHMGAVAEPERYIAVYTRFLGVRPGEQSSCVSLSAQGRRFAAEERVTHWQRHAVGGPRRVGAIVRLASASSTRS
jgi:pimeloyl-ACP methyl ester carboxylesterase